MPLYLSVLDSILLEKFEDELGDFVGGVGRGGSGMDCDPNHHRTESVLLVLSMGEETGGIDREASLHIGFHQLVNLGTDSVPHFVKWGAVNSSKRFGGRVGESASGLDPRILF